ncbi:MAG TPA: hypothetical protein VFI02_20055 [Armatimonadota bacterium]|nr:hypothetical protein [Armatimonadota bacterium]
MPQSLSVDEVADAIKKMSRRERGRLLGKIAEIEDLLEELDDIADVIRARGETTRPYEEFLEELKAEGRDIQTGD